MNERVLVIVEDDADLLEGWKDLFEFSGYKVHAFLSAREALTEHSALLEADMLISDYHLADRNGIELIRAARRIKPGLPAAILTGLKQDHVRQAADEAEVTLFFKPIDMGTIETHVDTVTARAADC